jgi:hypothetical protein
MRVIEGLRRAPAIMRANANYRWFIISRMLTRVGQIAEPFYIIYAIEALGLPAGVAGSTWRCGRSQARFRICCGAELASARALAD